MARAPRPVEQIAARGASSPASLVLDKGGPRDDEPSVHEPDAALSRILRVLADVAPLPPERVSLREAPGRALAEDVVASRPLPPFDSSQMDGYALRASAAPRPGARLRVAFDVFAGQPAPPPLPEGSCCRIFTGAAIPPGADAVEMQEEVTRRGSVALFRRAVARGRFVRAAGSDVPAGSAALARGTALDPGAIGLAAALGRSELSVFRRPRVGLLATGDEIAAIDRAPAAARIVDSNSHALAAAAAEAGAIPTLLPIARDDLASLRGALAGAADFDVLVTIGGVSVGARDLVRRALQEAGAALHFWRVAIRPGKPIAFGRLGRTAVFGLPGNPASALVTFELFVRPALRSLAGLGGRGRPLVTARLDGEVAKPAGLTQYLRARARVRRGVLVVEPLATQTSGDLRSVTGFQALVVLPGPTTRVRRGEPVQALLVGTPDEDE